MEIKDLYLNDLNNLDFCLKKKSNIKNIYIEITDMLRDDILLIEPEYFKDISRKTLRQRSLYTLGLEGCTHALLLSLFLRSDDEELKQTIKDLLDKHGINCIENYIKAAVISKRSLGRKFMEHLIESYVKNRDNEMNLSYQDDIYVKVINEYYKDSLGRIDQEEICREFGI